MEVHQERKNEKENLLGSSAFLDKDENEDNYVFIDEKYKKYFDNVSDIFEDKIEYVLNKHFKKNDPTNRNKLLCLNLCVLWQKKYLLLLSKTLNEYEDFKNKHNIDNNEKGREKDSEKATDKEVEKGRKKLDYDTEQKGAEGDEKKKESIKKESDLKGDNNTITTSTAAPSTTTTNNTNESSSSTTASITTATNKEEDKDLRSFIKNVKIIDNKNIEVVYDFNEINDNRPSAELSTEEIYYLLVESKKSENEYKKKIFTFLQYLPLIIQSMETKNYIEKKNLEDKLLFNEFNNMNNFQMGETNEHKAHVNQPNMDMGMENPNSTNNNSSNITTTMNNANNNNPNVPNINSINAMNNFVMSLDNIQENPVNGNNNVNDGYHLSEEEITNKLNAIVNFNYSLSDNLEKLFKNELGNGNDMTSHEEDIMNGDEKHKSRLPYKSPVNTPENYNIKFSSAVNGQNEERNAQNRRSLVLPLSRINDLSVINNISTKSNNITYEEVNENENEYLFYIYKNNMDKTNLYGLDILTNLNNKVLCKINHIYSLVQFYTMLAKDMFDDM